MLEKMGAFFDARLMGYDEHQLNCIEGAHEFYDFTAKCLPRENGANVLDLGCGTGLELEGYFKYNPCSKITGIDLAPGMLGELKRKFRDKEIKLVLGSYFDVPFGYELYDAAVSVESLHHFTKEEKILLYQKLHRALKASGYFILTDYFSQSDAEEILHREKLREMRMEEGIADGDFYHYDTPLTVQHEIEALSSAGFSFVEVLNQWGSTYTLRAMK